MKKGFEIRLRPNPEALSFYRILQYLRNGGARRPVHGENTCDLHGGQLGHVDLFVGVDVGIGDSLARPHLEIPPDPSLEALGDLTGVELRVADSARPLDLFERRAEAYAPLARVVEPDLVSDGFFELSDPALIKFALRW